MLSISFATVCLLSLIGCGGGSVEPIAVGDPAAITGSESVAAAATDWPWWRGPDSDNHAAGPLPPDEWSETKNVLWKADVPGRGHSTPIVCGEMVYVTTADEKLEVKSLLAFDRQTGKQQWNTPVHSEGFMHTHQKNSQASATPACDGAHIYTVFMVDQGVWASAVDLQGEIAWQTKAGDFKSRHGYGSSPLIYKSLLIVVGDSSGGAFLTAIYRDSGKIAWRTPRNNNASFGTPALLDVNGAPQLLVSGSEEVISYNPADGTELWRSEGPATTTANTMVAWNDLVFSSGGYPQRNLFAIRPSDQSIVWKDSVKVYVPSMLLLGDRLLAISDEGVAQLYAADTGDRVWRERLGGNFSSSPVTLDDRIYATNEAGKTFVFKAGDQLEILAENQLPSGGFASPVICDGTLYLRTDNQLFCIGHDDPADRQ